MNRQRVILRVISETYNRVSPGLPYEIIRYRLGFPWEVMPPYRVYISGINPHASSDAIPMRLSSQIKFTEILLYTKYVGEYTDFEDGEIMGQKISYFREHDGGAVAPTKVEPVPGLA